MPENTLLGFRHAIALGVDMLECDVHLTRDRRLVVMHDERVDRTTNGSGAIAEMSFADLRRLDAGRGERVPTADEVLEVAHAAGVPLLVELKGAGTPEPALEAVRARGMLEQVTFTSFALERIAEVRRLEPRARTGAIFGRGGPECVPAALSVGAAAVCIQFRTLTPALVEEARAAGLELRAWNPDTEEDQQATVALGPDGVSTNRPDRLLALLHRTR